MGSVVTTVLAFVWVGVAVFKDKDTCTANVDDPEQDAWFTKLRANMEADPEWLDGEVSGG